MDMVDSGKVGYQIPNMRQPKNYFAVIEARSKRLVIRIDLLSFWCS